MTHNTRVRPDLAAWGIPTAAVTAAELDALDAGQFKSINGDDGGVYAPIIPVTLGGAGLRVTGFFGASGTSLFSGDTQFQGETSFLDVANFQDTVLFQAHVDFDDTATFTEDATFDAHIICNSHLEVFDLAQFHDDVQMGFSASDVLTIEATSVVNGPANFNDDVNLTDVVIHGDAQIGTSPTDALNVFALATFEAAVAFNDDCDFGGDVTFHTTVNLGTSPTDIIDAKGTLNLRGPVTFNNGNGRVPSRPVVGGDASHSYSPTDYDMVYATGHSTTRTYSVDATNTVHGDAIVFVNANSSHDLITEGPGLGGYVLSHRPSSSTSSEWPWVEFKKIGSIWYQTRAWNPY